MSARVLVVDDVLANVKLLEARLSAEYFDVVTANCGTQALEICERAECDIVLLDVRDFGLTGRQAESALLDSGVVTNRNSVPNDPRSPFVTSGLRLGTPAKRVSGVSLPMVLRVMNYADHDLAGLQSIASVGGRNGVVLDEG